MDQHTLLYSLNRWGEFGQRKIQEVLSPNEKKRISIIVPRGSWMCIIKWRFGDINANVLNFRFDSCRNAWEQDILIGTELLNFITEPLPYIVASGDNGAVIISNTSAVEQDFEMVYDFYLVNDEIQGRIRELIYADRENFKAIITNLAGTGGA